MEIGIVVLEIQKAEFGKFTVPVNNTLVCLASSFVFLAADTLLCVLIVMDVYLANQWKNFNGKFYSYVSYCSFIAGTDESQSADLYQYNGN